MSDVSALTCEGRNDCNLIITDQGKKETEVIG